MPIFAFGQMPSPPNVGPLPFQDNFLRDAEQRRRDQTRLGNIAGDFILNELFNRGWEEGLAIIKHGPFLPAEVGSAILSPDLAGQGEEAAIALQEERARQEAAARRIIAGAVPARMGEADP